VSVADLTVLDLSKSVAGAYCAKLLADYGADVIKVEPPEGDPIRECSPFSDDAPSLEGSGLFTYLHLNRRGIVLDLATAEGQEHLLNLVKCADVLVESFTPGELAALGLDLVKLLSVNPRLVVTSITPFGQTGPYRDYRAPEIVLEAISGWMAGNGNPGEPPLQQPGNVQAELYGGIFGLIATLGAVRWQRRNGQGQLVDVSIAESVLYTLPNITTIAQYSGKDWERRPSYPPDNPPAGIFQCADGLIGSSAVYQNEVEPFCQLIGRPELADDPRFKTRADRVRNATALTEIIAEWMARHSAEEVYRRGQELRVPIARINSPRDLLESRQLAAREYWIDLEQPGLGSLRVPGAPFKLPASPWSLRRPAPRLGEHTDEILTNGNASGTRRAASTGAGRTRSAEASDCPQPLAGVRVLDLCMAWAGPLATRLLAGLGAEVIKIEGPQHMDRWRGGSIPSDKVESYPDSEPGERPYNRYALANTQNLNKLDLALNLKHPQGKEIFKRLVATADLVVENFSAGALARLGLDYPALREINPSIILVSLPSFGRSGPERDYVGHANFIEDTAGNTFLFGYAGGPPLHTGTAWGDPVAGVNAAAAALIALLHREASGEGQHVDVAHVEAAIPFNIEAVLDAVLNRRLTDRRGNERPDMVPHGCYRSRGEDSWVAIAVQSDAEWKALAREIGAPGWVEDPRFATRAGRLEHRAEIDHRIGAWTREHGHIEAMEALQRRGVAAGAVLRAGELCRDRQFAAREFLVSVAHPEAGVHRYPRPPWLMSESPARPIRPAPCFGEHNHYVLETVLGLSVDEIRELEDRGVVAAEPLPQYGV
jgi:crotonobetainyl-CoA:carnitine CoA-transferase CaiB-like acyl-CoA transferase